MRPVRRGFSLVAHFSHHGQALAAAFRWEDRIPQPRRKQGSLSCAWLAVEETQRRGRGCVLGRGWEMLGIAQGGGAESTFLPPLGRCQPAEVGPGQHGAGQQVVSAFPEPPPAPCSTARLGSLGSHCPCCQGPWVF